MKMSVNRCSMRSLLRLPVASPPCTLPYTRPVLVATAFTFPSLTISSCPLLDSLHPRCFASSSNHPPPATMRKQRSSEVIHHGRPLTANDIAEAELEGSVSSYRDDDTIVQVSSGFGVHGSAVGVAVIRISGHDAFKIVKSLTRRSSPLQPRHATLVTLYTQSKSPPASSASTAHSSISSTSSSSSSSSSSLSPSNGVIRPWSADMIDGPVIALAFPGPASFTGEDVVELHVHGNRIIVSQILRELTNYPNVRLAEAGEFTRRAFDHGKLDLTQVEGLADLLKAETEQQRKQALRQMDGQLTRLYQEWRTLLLTCVAHLEAVIDFAEDEADIGESEIIKNVTPQIEYLLKTMNQHLNDGRRGQIVRSGVGVAILGAPNAGKSTLLNSLAQRDVAIVSPIAGTTRDIIECSLDIGGYPVVLADTAGLRNTGDMIEGEGVRRALSRIAKADLKLALFDINIILDKNTPPSSQHEWNITAANDNIDTVSMVDKDTIVVFTKSDAMPSSIEHPTLLSIIKEKCGLSCDPSSSSSCSLPSSSSSSSSSSKWFANGPPADVCLISCEKGHGMEDLIKAIEKQVSTRLDRSDSSPPSITRERHRTHLNECIQYLNEYNELHARGELVRGAERLRQALRSLGRVAGRVDMEHLLDVIFNDFCIGK